MSEFLAVLALYYVCDATALVRPMSLEEVQACTATYDTVKTYFVAEFELAPPGTMRRFAQMSDAYEAFKDWEIANPELVASLRNEAMAQARGVALADG